MKLFLLLFYCTLFCSCKSSYTIYKYDVSLPLSANIENCYIIKSNNKYRFVIPSNNYGYFSNLTDSLTEQLSYESLRLDIEFEVNIDTLNERFIYLFEEHDDTLKKSGKSIIKNSYLLFSNYFISPYTYSNSKKLLNYDSSYILLDPEKETHFFRNQTMTQTLSYKVYPSVGINYDKKTLPIIVNVDSNSGLPLFIRYNNIVRDELFFTQIVCSDYKMVRCNKNNLNKFLW